MDRRAAVLAVVVVGLLVSGAVGTVAPVAAASCPFPYTATDSTGTAVTVAEPPARVVVLGGSAAQTMWDLGAADQVVGMPVQPYTTYLEGARNRTPVMNEGGFTVNVEAVVNLSPDLVLAPNIIPVETVAKLRGAGLTVYRFEAARSIEDVAAKTRRTGRLTGNCAAAEASISNMQERLAVVHAAVANESAPRVVYPLGGGYVAGRGTFLDAVLATAGGENVADRANITGYQAISPEVLVEQDPQWIVRSSDLPPSELRGPAWNGTTAVRRGQVVVVDGNLANQPAPRIVEPIETIAKALHPAAYAAANATARAAAQPTAAATDSPTTASVAAAGGPTTTTRPGAADQPGFGPAVAVGALLAFGLLRRR